MTFDMLMKNEATFITCYTRALMYEGPGARPTHPAANLAPQSSPQVYN